MESIFEKLQSSNDTGLSLEEVNLRIKKYGPNKLPEAKADTLLTIFLGQFKSSLIYILLLSSLIVFLIGEYTDALLILFVLIFNAIVGTIQEGKAQNTLLALKNFVSTKATVVRGGKENIVPDSELVPGDILILREGEKVPADCRVIISNSLRVDESALTGESEPVHKYDQVLQNSQLPSFEQKNMLFKGTHIMAGSGRAIVVKTGLKTFIGKISKEIASINTEIPLKTNIRNLSKLILLSVLIISATLFVIGLTSGNTVSDMFRTVVSLAVSIIPEGLPIVMTLILATGVWRMSKRNALIKKLHAVEALGQTNIIAVDKTGTITKNELIVEKVYVNDKIFEVTGEGYDPQGEIFVDGNSIDPSFYPELQLIGKNAKLSSSANLKFLDGQWQINGDPTEAALASFSRKTGVNLEKEDFEKIKELPFDYKFKFHATLYKTATEKQLVSVAGAPEVILNLCQTVYRSEKFEELAREKHRLHEIFEKMSSEGLRVVALAQTDQVPNDFKAENINSLTFVGFLGMQDDLRPEIRQTIEKANKAGIKVVMITGDHKITAAAIAKEAGIYHEGDGILTGEELYKISESELLEKIKKATVFARVSPDDKLKIVEAYKKLGKIIAMTGDGVNDAPSLVAADLGIAMGKIGTEVSKEAADIVLQDDNFASIISAVEEGRAIYKSIKKVILYLFSTSAGEVLVISGALVLGMPLPILPAQIIWLNLVTDGFLDMALAMEPKEKDLLKGKFEKSNKYLIDSLMVTRIIIMALVMAIGSLVIFRQVFEIDIIKAYTMALTAMAVFQWFNAWNCRAENKSIFTLSFFSNKYLVFATAIVVGLQIAAVYHPIFQRILHTTALSLNEWILIVAIGSTIIFIEEIRKLISKM